METTKNRFIELMNYFHIKQADIVEKTGLPKSAISMYVSGKRQPRQDKLTIISDAYGINEAWLMGYDIPMFKTEQEKLHKIQKTGEYLGKLFHSNMNDISYLLLAYQHDPEWIMKQCNFCQEMSKEQRELYLTIGENILKERG